ncbi:unnamed protein product [Caenorhabditis auriculariae]|uniref:Uncharacterized protein n=1 Tax=Caenorhabditis auriculariae TaxID=2777116 RepID=A0A8S1H220_9PELO|nr:unnamed protein product [Caenorhabditis auriculariae]
MNVHLEDVSYIFDSFGNSAAEEDSIYVFSHLRRTEPVKPYQHRSWRRCAAAEEDRTPVLSHLRKKKPVKPYHRSWRRCAAADEDIFDVFNVFKKMNRQAFGHNVFLHCELNPIG